MERLIRKTTAQQVAEAIELAILSGEFGHGARIPPERRLAAMLGVSRLTLREGLNRLVARGILVAVPGLGTFVSSVELTHSIDLLASQYLMEKVPQRKVELVRHFLETRRVLLSSVVTEAVRRTTPDQLEWIIDGFIRMVGAAQFNRDLRAAAEMEIRAIHIAAEKANIYHFWLMLNSLRDFFRVAQNEIVAGSRLEQYERRGNELVSLIRQRDADGIVQYVRSEYEASDRTQLLELERRVLKPAAPDRPAPSAPPPPQVQECPESEAKLEKSEPGTNGHAGTAHARTDPSSWHRWFIDWYQRNFQCNPWDNPDEIPPGPSIDDKPAREDASGTDPPEACTVHPVDAAPKLPNSGPPPGGNTPEDADAPTPRVVRGSQ
jgi:GntR family transcriptional regulator, transcriptional repressor for pyruvate dehydrogenase complex